MRAQHLATGVIASVICLAGALLLWPAENRAAEPATATAGQAADIKTEPPAPPIDNQTCLGCHGNKEFGVPGADGTMRHLYVKADKFAESVHAKRGCVECHNDIMEIPHKLGVQHKVSCVECHESLWDKAKLENKTQEFARLGVVVEQIDKYMKSIHARPSRADQSRTNATCYNCHDAHYIDAKGSEGRQEWRLNIPNVCGKCHVKEREQYGTSVHGKEVLENRNAFAAICSDCHTTHDVEHTSMPSTRVAITRSCGNCHPDSLKSYIDTYHGQVTTLGYAYTAKCFDCHGNHGIQRVSDPASSVHPNNRLQTCRKCHADATPGFVSFEPHATTHDFERYPYTWIASKLMIGLLGGTFAFFWTHTALWFFREYKDRKQRKTRPHVLTSELLADEGKWVRRWSPGWRLAHLVFALSLMGLVLTGMTVFYANTAWALAIANLLGGPKIAAIIHRVLAVIFVSIFMVHLAIFLARTDWKKFKWFGPNSLVPNWQDLKDCVNMFKWFFGLGPRPVFDRFTYWEKFDYWAPFWGVTIIGGSGLMLWFKSFTAAYLPGWVFNVAMIAHGEEAVLATGFLFTVHFFNNHFRPDKFPLDTQMFTGVLPLDEFRKEHTVEYDRLVKTGELEKYIVDAPSAPLTLGSKILGFTLIIVGLFLLTFVMTGFVIGLRVGG